jgi:hypothetical protein
VAPEDANDALYRHVTERVSFLQGLVERRPELAVRLESELGAQAESTGAQVIPDRALLATLPPGLALALAALPLGRDPVSGVVHVAAANANDSHLAAELSYHLAAPVELTAAPLRALLDALATSAEGDPTRHPTPAFGTGMLGAERKMLRPSERPIPLVRRSVEPAPPTTARHGSLAPPAPVEVRTPASRSLAPLPIISLTSTRPLGTPNTTAQASAKVVDRAPPAEPLPPPAAALLETEETALDDLARAGSAEEVVAALIEGLRTVASMVIVLAARGKNFEGRDASDGELREKVRGLSIPSDRPSILQTAVQSLGYVGPLPSTPVHEALATILGNPTGEVAAGAVMVSGRAALVYVAAGLVTTYLATRRADRLAEAAAKALSRIVRGRKK